LATDDATHDACPGSSRRRLGSRCAPTRGVPAHHNRWITRHVAGNRLLKIARPAAATVLAVRKDIDPGLLLHLEHAQDLAILHFAQLVERQTALLIGRAGRLELVGPQKAADLVRAKARRRHQDPAHRTTSLATT